MSSRVVLVRVNSGAIDFVEASYGGLKESGCGGENGIDALTPI
jgi:hypothetical protein